MTVFPHGLPAIIRTYGNPVEYLEAKQAWEHIALEVRPLPQPLPYAYMTAVRVSRIRAHRLVVDVFLDAITQCLDRGVPPDRLVYGGIYAYRGMRDGTALSTHAWGIAVDWDPRRNPMGEPWQDDGHRLDPRVIAVFEGLGFTWGGHWSRPDPMHFQACAGY